MVNETLKSPASRPLTIAHATVKVTSSRVKNGRIHTAARIAQPRNSVRERPKRSASAPMAGDAMKIPRPPAPSTIPTAVAGSDPEYNRATTSGT